MSRRDERLVESQEEIGEQEGQGGLDQRREKKKLEIMDSKIQLPTKNLELRKKSNQEF
jgi:hypothetical protein